jgi:hypothetical protein
VVNDSWRDATLTLIPMSQHAMFIKTYRVRNKAVAVAGDFERYTLLLVQKWEERWGVEATLR